jgi:FtsZ-binding cell division protein ZapB
LIAEEMYGGIKQVPELQWIMQSILLIMVSAISYFLKKTIDELKEQDKEIKDDINRLRRETQEEIDALRQDTEDFKQKAPFIYTLREDHIRWAAAVDHKLDKIYEVIHKAMPTGGK